MRLKGVKKLLVTLKKNKDKMVDGIIAKPIGSLYGW